ncbi:PHD finger protein ALFIN-LIKE 2-like [Iris pallida]|uniref:PHD finger protein ALFIN-LIKE n=1 Tax=Iris pallida TaxID=29817 RepID=A0AAX6DPR0_IRIPA|nr:PHD finger protein ALFIN-LIKE 2-like [Iris pallida]
MEIPSISSAPRTVEEMFKDYSGRRSGIVLALTQDVEDFYGLCDPGGFRQISVDFRVLCVFVCGGIRVYFGWICVEKENLCLYGHPNSSWEVTLPAEEVPPINFARDGMNRRDWLSFVAVHSDSWLLSVAFYLGARFNGNERKRLFTMINELPTVFELVSERKQGRDKSGMDSGSKSKLSTKRTSEGHIKHNSKPPVGERYGDEEDEHSETLCGTCGGKYNSNEFWIGSTYARGGFMVDV